MLRVLYATNIPSPYRVDFFNCLGEFCDLTVTFESNDAKGREDSWISSDFKNFNAVFLKGKRVGEAEAFCPEIIKYIKQKFDIVVIGMYSSPTSMLAIEYMKLHNIKFIINSDGAFIKEDKHFVEKIKKHFISSASAWIGTSESTKDYFVHYGAKKENVNIYPFSSVKNKDILNLPVSNEEKITLKQELGIKENKMILSVGRIVHIKGYDMLIEASKMLDSNEYGFYVIGGKITEEFQSIIESQNVSNVHFIDFMDFEGLSKYYKAADEFVLATRYDPWGLVVNEALAFGLPVITTNKCNAGIAMIEDGNNGQLFKVEDVKALASAIEKSSNIDPNNCLNTARDYTIEKMAEKHLEIFRSYLKEND